MPTVEVVGRRGEAAEGGHGLAAPDVQAIARSAIIAHCAMPPWTGRSSGTRRNTAPTDADKEEQMKRMVYLVLALGVVAGVAAAAPGWWWTRRSMTSERQWMGRSSGSSLP